MSHESLEHREEARGSSNRSFGLVFATVFAVIAVWPLFFGGTPRWWSAVVGIAVLIIALSYPDLLEPANKLWTRFGAVLHSIVSPIVLGLMFFVVVTPMGMLMRLFGKRPLTLRYDQSAPTYWIERQPEESDATSLKNQF